MNLLFSCMGKKKQKKEEREEKTIKLSPISCELRMSPVTEEPGRDAGGGTGDGNQMDMPKLLQTPRTEPPASAKQLEQRWRHSALCRPRDTGHNGSGSSAPGGRSTARPKVPKGRNLQLT